MKGKKDPKLPSFKRSKLSKDRRTAGVHGRHQELGATKIELKNLKKTWRQKESESARKKRQNEIRCLRKFFSQAS